MSHIGHVKYLINMSERHISKKECKDERYDEHNTNSEGTYISMMAWQIWLRFGMGGALYRGNFHSKNCYFCSGIIKLKVVFS